MDRKYMMPEDCTLLERAKELRRNMTQEERKLWYLFLRKHRFRFYRQKIIGHYICDFYCPQVRLVIELDGSQHYTEKEEAYDRKRTVFLESYHIQVIRFYNGKINLHFKKVCMEIERVIDERIKAAGNRLLDSPFRLAPLATHPLSGGGQEKHGGKEELTQTLVSPAEL